MANTSYIDALALEIHANAHPDENLNSRDLPLYRTYAVLLLAKGEAVTAEDVHNAWAAWATGTEAKHPDIIPFEDLTPETRSKDEPYVLAIRRVAQHSKKG